MDKINQPVLIFGADNYAKKGIRKGFRLTVNFKNGNAYISTELKNKLFGESATEGCVLLICSPIENNWYITKSKEPGNGYECKLNDPNVQTSMRVNGMLRTVEKMAKSANLDVKESKYTFEVSDTPIEYNGMQLYKIIL